MAENITIIIETHYCPKSDKTFITEERIEGNKHRLKVVGFYFGEPNCELTRAFLYNDAPAVWEGVEVDETGRD